MCSNYLMVEHLNLEWDVGDKLKRLDPNKKAKWHMVPINVQ